MRLGLGSYALAWAVGVPGYPPERPLDAFGFVERAAEYGFGLVQIADNLPLHTLSEDDLGRLRSLARRLSIDVEVGARGIAGGNLERYLGLAQFFGSPLLRVVVDSAGHYPPPAEIVSTVRDVLPRFERAGVVLAIENHDRFKARDLLGIIENLDSPSVGVCLDTANSFGALEGPEVVVATLAPHIVNLHLKDFTVRREDHNLGFRVVGAPAGGGDLDIPWLLDALRGAGREIDAILELWPSPERNVGETIKKEAAWLEQSQRYLEGLVA